MWSWSHECNPHQWNKREKKESNIGKFTRLIDLSREIEWKLDGIIESWFIAKITTKIFICCLSRLTRKISSSLCIFFCEFSIRIDSIPIWHKCISSTSNKFCISQRYFWLSKGRGRGQKRDQTQVKQRADSSILQDISLRRMHLQWELLQEREKFLQLSFADYEDSWENPRL